MPSNNTYHLILVSFTLDVGYLSSKAQPVLLTLNEGTPHSRSGRAALRRYPSSNVTSKVRKFQKNIYFCFIDYAKAFGCVDHNELWKFVKRWEFHTILPGFFLPWTLDISSWLLQQSVASAPYLERGYSTFKVRKGCIEEIPLIQRNVQGKKVPEKHLFLLIDYAKAFDCVDHNKLWEILKEMGIPRPPDLPLEKSVCRSGSNS